MTNASSQRTAYNAQLVLLAATVTGTAATLALAPPAAASPATRIIAAQPAANVWRLAQDECTNRLDEAHGARSITLEPTRLADGSTVIVRCTRTRVGVSVSIRAARSGETLR